MATNREPAELIDTDPVFVDAYSKETGEKQRVPAHFFDVPSLCAGLSKTPRQKASETRKAPGAGDNDKEQ